MTGAPTGDPAPRDYLKVSAWVDGTWAPFDKLEAHRLGLKHKAVSVFVLDRDRVLLQQRALAKYHTPGLWTNACCTHPLWNETAADCARRRLGEELGLTDLPVTFRHALEYRADVGQGMIEHEMVDVFVAPADAATPLDPNPDEVLDVRWIDLDDLKADLDRRPNLYTPWLKIYLDRHASEIFPTA